MVTVDDVLHHIAQDLRCYKDADRAAAINEFLTGCVFDLHISITTDFEATELDYLERYGKGRTYYFRLGNYDHGKRLAEQIFFLIRGIKPDMGCYTGKAFAADDKLFLFVHIREVVPPPVARLN